MDSARVAAALSLALLVGDAGCAGKGAVSWDQQVKPVIDATCVHCHNPKTIDDVVKRTCAATLPDGAPDFDASRFIAEYVTKASDKTAADTLFAAMCPASAPRNAEKDRVLYGLKQLKDLLAQPPQPDYTSADAFIGFATARNKESYEGCEMIDFLDKGDRGAADGMPPLWAAKLMEILAEPYQPATADGRAVIRKFVESLLPYGAGSCTGGTSGS